MSLQYRHYAIALVLECKWKITDVAREFSLKCSTVQGVGSSEMGRQEHTAQQMVNAVLAHAERMTFVLDLLFFPCATRLRAYSTNSALWASPSASVCSRRRRYQ